MIHRYSLPIIHRLFLRTTLSIFDAFRYYNMLIILYGGDNLMSVRDKEEGQEELQKQEGLATDLGDTLFSAYKNSWECTICNKKFGSLYILNYHRLLEHSKDKRPPIGVA